MVHHYLDYINLLSASQGWFGENPWRSLHLSLIGTSRRFEGIQNWSLSGVSEVNGGSNPELGFLPEVRGKANGGLRRRPD